MSIATLVLCLQGSLLFSPLHRGEEPPELRAVRHARLLHDGVEELARPVRRTEEEALETARDLVQRLNEGTDFDALADRVSDAGPGNSVLGSFVQGALAPALDEFLFTAELGAISDPIRTEGGVVVLQRIEVRAAVRTIRIDGTGPAARERARAIATELREGADFGALAAERSDDTESAARDGRFAVFERGPRDALLKSAAFDLDPGEWTGPLETPIGMHFLLREDPEGYPQDLWESHFARFRTILVRHELSEDEEQTERDVQAAHGLARSLWDLLEQGRSFEELAARFDEDTGGKQRAGDLGWVHRRTPSLPRFLQLGFLLDAGEYTQPRTTSSGYVLVYRSR